MRVCVCVCVCVCVDIMLYFECRKLKERVTQLDSENTVLTRAHIER